MSKNGWRDFTLGDLIQNKSKRFDFENKQKVVFINTGDILKGIFLHENKISSVGLPGQAKKAISKNDILFSEIRPANGRFALVDFDSDIHVVSTKFMVLSLISKEVYLKYVYLILTSNLYLSEFQRIAESRSGTFPQITFDAISYLPISLPPLPTQKVIAKILGDLDAKIEINRKMNENLEAMAQALFQSWFVDFDPVLDNFLAKNENNIEALPAPLRKKGAIRLEVSKKNTTEVNALFPNNFVFNEILEKWIPEGWNVKSLDEIASYQNGLALQKFRPENENDKFLPVLKISHLKQGRTDGKEKARIDIKKECIVESGDVIFSWSASLLVDLWCGGKCALNQHLFKVTSKNYSKWFYYLYTKHHLDEFISIANDKAVTMGHIKREHLREAKCLIMSKELMSFADLTFKELIEKQIKEKLETQNLTKLRDTLLPQLISGKLEVPEAMLEIEKEIN